MARKSLGYTKLIWICPNCQTRNPGPKKTCTTCGSPQPEDVSFIQADREDLLRKEEDILRAKQDADIHCPFCGTRNPADAKVCSQCGGQLAGGKKRAKGKIVWAHKGGKGKGVQCPTCENLNPPNAPHCVHCGGALGKIDERKPQEPQSDTSGKVIWIVVGLLAVLIAVLLLSRGCSQSTEIATVERTNWERTVAIEQYNAVQREDWWDNIPDDAFVTACEERYRYTRNQPEENSIEVCGTPYTVDQGSGFGEVVQDCEYEVYDTYCEYEVSDWEVVEILEMDGYGTSANWPLVEVYSDQRAGETTETYTIWFETEEGSESYTTDDFSLFQSCRVGSEWELSFDGFGNIRAITPYKSILN